MRVHLKYFCGEGAQKTEAQARQERTADRSTNRREGSNGNGGSGGKKGGLKKKQFPKTTTAKKSKTFPSSATQRNKHLGTKVASTFGAETFFGEVTSTRTSEGVDLFLVTYSDGDKEELELAELHTAIKRYQAAQTNSKKPRKPHTTKRKGAEEDEETNTVDVSPTTGRPSRSAARTAVKLMSASMKEWTTGDTKGADDDSFGGDDDSDPEDSDDDESVISYDEEDSEGEAISSPPARKKALPKKKAKKSPESDSDDSESESDSDDSESESSEDEAALARVRKRQKAALARARKGTEERSLSPKMVGKLSSKARRKGLMTRTPRRRILMTAKIVTRSKGSI